MRRCFILIIGWSFYAVASGSECEPGTSGCISDETDWKLKENVQAASAPSELPHVKCTPGERKQVDCNYCTCTDDGLFLCTKRYCFNIDSDTEVKTIKEEAECTPGQRKQIDCNSCMCTDLGIFACTKKFCFKDDPDADVKTVAFEVQGMPRDIQDQQSNRLKRQACTPSSTFQRDCNVCKCDTEGTSYSCTQNECMERGGNRDVEVFMESEGIDHIERESVCHSRATFQVNCNTCICNADGTDYRCTNNVCPLPADVELFKELKDETHVVPLKKCDPNGEFFDGCRKCRCNENGTDYTCTKTACKSRHPRKEDGKSENSSLVCKANTAFRKDCNTCWCNEDGTSYFCTRKVCVPALDDNVDQPEEMQVIEKECRPREVFELDCNTCRCNEQGKSFSCTSRACVTDTPPDAVDYKAKDTEPVLSASRLRRQVESAKANTKACEPGSQFRVDCNTCLCHTDGQSFACTRYDCTATPPPQPPQPAADTRRKREVGEKEVRDCEPGSVFAQGCNVCRCASDGRHASCTLKKCTGTAHKPNEVTSPENDFRCTPGEQFKRSCNDCTCSADGKSVFCTIKLCEKEIVSQV